MKQHLLRTTVCWLALLGFMFTTQPDKLPVIVLIVPFVLLFTVFLQTWTLLQMAYVRYLTKNNGRKLGTRFAKMVSASITLLIVLQSLGQLTTRDVVTVLTIGTIGYLYMTRYRSQDAAH